MDQLGRDLLDGGADGGVRGVHMVEEQCLGRPARRRVVEHPLPGACLARDLGGVARLEAVEEALPEGTRRRGEPEHDEHDPGGDEAERPTGDHAAESGEHEGHPASTL